MEYINDYMLPPDKTGVLLMVDEIMQANGPHDVSHRVTNIVVKLGSTLQKCDVPDWKILVTTTQMQALIDAQSRAREEWIPLDSPTPDVTAVLFPAETDSESAIAHYYAMLTGGHFGTLERGLETWEGWRHLSVDSITLDTIKAWAALGHPRLPSKELIADALSGRKSHMNTHIGKYTLNQWMEDGVCIQSMRHIRFLPHRPALRLLSLYGCLDERDELDAPRIFPQLKSLLESCVPSQVADKQAPSFARFHLHWENVRRYLLYSPVGSLGVSHPASFCEVYDIISIRKAERKVAGFDETRMVPKSDVITLTSPLSTLLDNPPAMNVLLDHFFLFEDDHADLINSFYLQLRYQKELVFVGIDNQYPGGDTTIEQYVNHKMEALMATLFPNDTTERMFGEGEDQYTLLKKRVVMVFACFQHFPKDPSKWPANVVVLDRGRLETLYTPTLTPFPALCMSHPHLFKSKTR